jgi:ABC-type multidrug transport system fused ATPase/permease subunit
VNDDGDGDVELEVCMWMYTGDRQSARIRTMYVKALITQDVGFFDTDISTGEVVMGISSDTSLIQDAIGVKVGSSPDPFVRSLLELCSNFQANGVYC